MKMCLESSILELVESVSGQPIAVPVSQLNPAQPHVQEIAVWSLAAKACMRLSLTLPQEVTEFEALFSDSITMALIPHLGSRLVIDFEKIVSRWHKCSTPTMDQGWSSIESAIIPSKPRYSRSLDIIWNTPSNHL